MPNPNLPAIANCPHCKRDCQVVNQAGYTFTLCTCCGYRGPKFKTNNRWLHKSDLAAILAHNRIAEPNVVEEMRRDTLQGMIDGRNRELAEKAIEIRTLTAELGRYKEAMNHIFNRTMELKEDSVINTALVLSELDITVEAQEVRKATKGLEFCNKWTDRAYIHDIAETAMADRIEALQESEVGNDS